MTLAYLIFDRPDLERAERFLSDFGFVTVQHDESTLLLRGTDPTPLCYVVRKTPEVVFVGFGLQVTGHAALDVLTKLPGASAIKPLDQPDDGYRVRLAGPSGLRVNAIADQAPAAELPHRLALSLNSVDAPLRINGAQRPSVGILEVIHLGYVALELADFQITYAWYTQYFGFIPSDVQALPGGSPAVIFMRLDLGDMPTDHHAFALAQGLMSKYSHNTFKLISVDAVGMGYRMLREQGWKHTQRSGRHILGSQTFDYQQDPWGGKHEHYCDGNLFTVDQPTDIHPVNREAMLQWGQSIPASFAEPKLTPAIAAALIHNLRRSSDLTLRKLITLARVLT